MSTESEQTVRQVLNGPTMGTRWQATFFTAPGFDPVPVEADLQRAVDEVDAQMSTWKPKSALMRLNAAPVGQWVDLPDRLATVLRKGLAIGKITGGAFDIAMGDAVTAWGFGPEEAAPERIRSAMTAPRRPAHEVLELASAPATPARARKHAPITLDLNGIAKGYGVDRLAEVLGAHGIASALVGIDGELRAIGVRPDGTAWPIAVEAPDPERRAAHSVLVLEDAAVATSGDYRHWVEIGGRRLSHTMDPRRGAPLLAAPASVTVVAQSCARADAWATALMVLGADAGGHVARANRLESLFLLRREDGSITTRATGPLFGGDAAPPCRGA